MRSDATKFRDYLFAKGLNGASVARIFGTVRAVINLTLSEFGLAIVNPFSNVYFDRSQGIKKRFSIMPEDIKKFQAECYEADYDKRWLFRNVEQFASGKGLLNYIYATEAFNRGVTSSRRQECHYFGHLHLFPNLVRETKHENEEVPISDDLRIRLAIGCNSSGRTYN